MNNLTQGLGNLLYAGVMGFFMRNREKPVNPTRRDTFAEIGGEPAEMMRRDTSAWIDRYRQNSKKLTSPFTLPHNRAKAALDMGVALKDTVFILRDWGEALKKSQERLRDFNPAISGAYVESERRGIMRTVKSGSTTDYTTKKMVSSLDDLKDTIRPYQDLMTNVMNQVVVHLVAMVKYIESWSPGMRTMVDAANKWLDDERKNEEGATWFENFHKGIVEDAKRDAAARGGRRAR